PQALKRSFLSSLQLGTISFILGRREEVAGVFAGFHGCTVRHLVGDAENETGAEDILFVFGFLPTDLVDGYTVVGLLFRKPAFWDKDFRLDCRQGLFFEGGLLAQDARDRKEDKKEMLHQCSLEILGDFMKSGKRRWSSSRAFSASCSLLALR